MKLTEIKKELYKSIEINIEETTNFITLARLKQCRRDLKYANRNKTMYIISFLMVHTTVFDSYMGSINYKNFNFNLS